MIIPPTVFSSDSTRRISTRSCNGRNAMNTLLAPQLCLPELALFPRECCSDKSVVRPCQGAEPGNSSWGVEAGGDRSFDKRAGRAHSPTAYHPNNSHRRVLRNVANRRLGDPWGDSAEAWGLRVR